MISNLQIRAAMYGMLAFSVAGLTGTAGEPMITMGLLRLTTMPTSTNPLTTIYAIGRLPKEKQIKGDTYTLMAFRVNPVVGESVCNSSDPVYSFDRDLSWGGSIMISGYGEELPKGPGDHDVNFIWVKLPKPKPDQVIEIRYGLVRTFPRVTDEQIRQTLLCFTAFKVPVDQIPVLKGTSKKEVKAELDRLAETVYKTASTQAASTQPASASRPASAPSGDQKE